MPDGNEDFSYALALRQVGAWLDAQGPQHFTVMETTTALTVVVMGGIGGAGVHEIAFDRHELMTESLNLGAGRNLRDSKWSLSAHGRSDFLRALGFELDAVGAAVIVIDELDSGVMTSYSYVDPQQGPLWRKRMLTLESSQIDQVVAASRGRRRPPTRRGLFEGLFGGERRG